MLKLARMATKRLAKMPVGGMQNTQHKTGPLRKVSIVESIISVKHHPAILTMVAEPRLSGRILPIDCESDFHDRNVRSAQ